MWPSGAAERRRGATAGAADPAAASPLASRRRSCGRSCAPASPPVHVVVGARVDVVVAQRLAEADLRGVAAGLVGGELDRPRTIPFFAPAWLSVVRSRSNLPFAARSGASCRSRDDRAARRGRPQRRPERERAAAGRGRAQRHEARRAIARLPIAAGSPVTRGGGAARRRRDCSDGFRCGSRSRRSITAWCSVYCDRLPMSTAQAGCASASPSSSTAASRILYFWTLPVTVIGNSSTKVTYFGTL